MQKDYRFVAAILSLAFLLSFVIFPPSAHAASTAAGVAPEASNPPPRTPGSFQYDGIDEDGPFTGVRLTNIVQSPQPAFYTGPIKDIALATSFTCALTGDGGVKCWGDNAFGTLGNGTTADSLVPVNVLGLESGVIAISAQHKHACALTAAGGVKCWGYNRHGELGNGTNTDSSVPVDVIGLNSGVKEISVGGFHTCAVLQTGEVMCWGANWHGEVGDGSTEHRAVPVKVTDLPASVVHVVTGQFHTCALDVRGAALCWGYNRFGQIGVSGEDQFETPQQPQGLYTGVTALAAGGFHNCVIQYGTLKCWGDNHYRQLGVTWTESTPSWVSPAGVETGNTGLVLGLYTTCLVRSTGPVYCTGDNWAGQMGDGTLNQHLTAGPTLVQSGSVKKLVLGPSHACEVNTESRLLCWGSNAFGQVGDGTSSIHFSPTFPVGFESGSTTQVTAGSGHACALRAGEVFCWGNNQYGQLGDGTNVYSLVPIKVSGLPTPVISIAAGAYFTCAVTGTNVLYCWGRNSSGQLGIGSTDDHWLPTKSFEGVRSVSAGIEDACVISTTGGLYCWGDNDSGQVGNDSLVNQWSPVQVHWLASDVLQVAIGEKHTCALMSSGKMKCWGANASGQLGSGDTQPHDSPWDIIAAGSDNVMITTGQFHTCTLKNYGIVYCWGHNLSGQVGNGTYDAQVLPTPVLGLTGVVFVEAGFMYNCAIMVDSSVKCWGDNWSGQLGDGTSETRNTEVDANTGGDRFSVLAGGGNFTCGINTNGAVQCWGGDDFGQIGDGSLPWRVKPVDALYFQNPRLAPVIAVGQAGSYFKLVGVDFPDSKKVTVTVNGITLQPDIEVSDTGSLEFFLDTSLAGPGVYGVTLHGVMPNISTFFTIDPGATLISKDGTAATLVLPAMTGDTMGVFLPMLTR